MSKFNSTQSIGDIVAILPKASEVFKKFNIDFCCGGGRPLLEAITKQKLNEQEVLASLDEAYEEVSKYNDTLDFRNISPSDLIDHIVNKHHGFLYKILPELSELTTKILRVHGSRHGELSKVHKLFHIIKTELDQHLIKEEEILFPMIKAYSKERSKGKLDKITEVINEIEGEHEAAGDVLKELRIITNQYRVPEDGCGTFELTYEKLQELESDLFQHIHLENNILFKELDIEVK